MLKLFNNKGSLTIEAVLVFSMVLLCVSVLVSTLMFMYNKVLLMKIAVDSAEEAAVSWNENGGLYTFIKPQEEIILQDTVEGATGLNEKSKQLMEGLRSKPESYTEKLKAICADLYQRLARSPIKPQRTTLVIKLSKDILTTSLQVTVTQDFKVPFARIKAFFDGKEFMTLSATGTATIISATQYIRNVDLSLEYIRRLKNGEIMGN
ncbi:MAG: hypothetical protein CVU87_06705 [Firmicutes bacterium HGW-Firmicutes-12]|jgi:hypothetical protein|nr:MAG: hypothetical protein CVU87_06705 [Firmicutes bacterium HGW-Firmicutes-12]